MVVVVRLGMVRLGMSVTLVARLGMIPYPWEKFYGAPGKPRGSTP